MPKTPGTRIQERAPSSGRLGSEVRERYVRPTEFRRSGLEVRTIEDQRERERGRSRLELKERVVRAREVREREMCRTVPRRREEWQIDI